MRISEAYPGSPPATSGGAGAEPARFALPETAPAEAGTSAPDAGRTARLGAMEGRLDRVGRDIADLRALHAAIADAGGRFVHHLGARIASIETAIGALRAYVARKERENDGGRASKEAELARLESSLREILGFSGLSEAELSGMLAHLMAAQGDAQAMLAMIERLIAALQAEFAAARA